MAGSLVYLACMALVCLIGLMAFGTYDPGFVELYIAQGLTLIKKMLDLRNNNNIEKLSIIVNLHFYPVSGD